jgi:hypothetical protein
MRDCEQYEQSSGQMPLCALRSMQIFTRRPNAASRTVRVAASKSASRSSGQFSIAAAVSRAISFPARTSSTMRSRSISSNFNITPISFFQG